MKVLKRYFNRESKFSLKERFNMVMTVVTCFFMGVMHENEKVMQGIRELISRQAVNVNEWLSAVAGWKLGVHRAYGVYEKGMVGRWFLGRLQKRFDVADRGQALVERAGMRGKRGNRIRDVSHEKGLPCIGQRVCRGGP